MKFSGLLGSILLPALVAAAGILASCREAPPAPIPPPTPVPEPAPPAGKETSVDIFASNIAFDKKTITVPAGARITVTFTNNESFIFHNFAIYETSAATGVVFKGDFTQAGTTSTYSFTAPSKPGTYFFRCDVHPTLMTGDFIVTAEESSQGSPPRPANGKTLQTREARHVGV